MSRAFVLMALLLAAAPAMAQDMTASRRDLAERAVVTIYEDEITDRIMEVFWPVALEAIRARAPGVTELQLFQYHGKAAGFAREAAHAGLVPLVDMFEAGFTAEELAAVVAFYETPAGAKFHGAQGAIASVLSGAAGESLRGEVNAMRSKVDAMLSADGY